MGSRLGSMFVFSSLRCRSSTPLFVSLLRRLVSLTVAVLWMTVSLLPSASGPLSDLLPGIASPGFAPLVSLLTSSTISASPSSPPGPSRRCLYIQPALQYLSSQTVFPLSPPPPVPQSSASAPAAPSLSSKKRPRSPSTHATLSTTRSCSTA